MTNEYERAIESLSPIQRTAVEWTDGAALVLAGPGAGKTRVLTTRVARLLKESPTRSFKVLALTFTTKAAKEMRDRVEVMIPEIASDRTFIGTFHAFCVQILRTHGSHIGIRPDFGLYDQKSERAAVLGDALRGAIAQGQEFATEDVEWLDAIDELKARMIVPEKAAGKVQNQHMPKVYQLYEEALRGENALDFSGLILETCRLLAKMPSVAKRIRQTYPYWMIDEFQDTSPAQYWLLHYMAGGEFKDVFVVADDDQIIYQWAGASYRQIERFRDQFKPELIQLVENHRCPAEIVSIANKLVAHNTQRTPDKREIVATKAVAADTIALTRYERDGEEIDGIVNEIISAGENVWGEIAVLGRTRSLLTPLLNKLRGNGVKASLVQRRDTFVSPHFVWLQALLDQSVRPTNRRTFAVFVNAANRVTDLSLDPAILIAEAEASGLSYFEHWAAIAQATESVLAQKLGALTAQLANARSKWQQIAKDAIQLFLSVEGGEEGGISDVADDRLAWEACMKEIRAEVGAKADIAEVVQGLALRSKEPPRDPSAVSLLTVHGSKGLEFDHVYLLGLAEGVMPSWQSVKKGDASAEMEEERRNCFVAITRTKKQLRLSVAKTYNGWGKENSRFLREMDLKD